MSSLVVTGNASGAAVFTIAAPGTATNRTLTLPDVTGTLAVQGAASINDIFYENGQAVTSNYTITTNKNAMSAGPITINSGITVTIPSGSNWAIV
jgi:hypothetical protein